MKPFFEKCYTPAKLFVDGQIIFCKSETWIRFEIHLKRFQPASNVFINYVKGRRGKLYAEFL